MDNCAIVCEYNPFHSGHKYQLDRVRERGASEIFCVMSGNFVQSAMPAFCDKAIRARCAVKGGADAVIELPTVYATASAGYFAEGAIKIISKIKNVSHIAMGATSPSETILRIAELKTKYSEKCKILISDALKNGKSYNFACKNALSVLYEKYYTNGADIDEVLNEPNNMLCVEYICAIEKYSANIEPLIIMRSGAFHTDTYTEGEHISATAIRAAMSDGNTDVAARYVPYDLDIIAESRDKHAPDIEAFNKAALFAIKTADTAAIAKLRDGTDGLEYLVKQIDAGTYDDFVKCEKLKKFGKKRIDRLLLDCLLGIEKEHLSLPFITRLLACSDKFDFKLLPENVLTTNAEIRSAAAANEHIRSVLAVDERAAILYGTLTRSPENYYNYSLIKL